MRNARRVAENIIAAFESGNVPRPLAQVFIHRSGIPMDEWSYLNRFMCALAGCTDARGFKQWQQVGRHVRKGETARTWILVPLVKKGSRPDEDGERADGDEEGPVLYGFRESPVFDISQTEGEPLPEQEEHQAFIDSRPLLDVAKRFGLRVEVFDAKRKGALGSYNRQRIGLGVENLSTWLHELVHAADDRLGNLKERGQHWASETVAELGGATLAVLLGEEEAADIGGAYEYIKAYAERAGIQPVTACRQVLERTAEAIQLILDTAQREEAASGS